MKDMDINIQAQHTPDKMNSKKKKKKMPQQGTL